MAATAIAISAGGALSWFHTTVLLTVQETVAALQKAASIGYRPPGKKVWRASLAVLEWSLPSEAVLRGANAPFGPPCNSQMEPARPTVLCDHVAAARGAFGTLGAQCGRRARVSVLYPNTAGSRFDMPYYLNKRDWWKGGSHADGLCN